MRTASGLLCATLLALLSLAAPLRAQQNSATEVSASELVRLTIAHEMKAAEDDSHKHLFRSRKQIPRGSQTRLYVETNDSMAGMTIAYNYQPLNPQQQKAEQDHLAWLASNPEQLRKILNVSLHSMNEPLRDWQAVVIGGGLINGVSQRGVWPQSRFAEIIASNPSLSERWQRALDLQNAQHAEAHVAPGDRLRRDRQQPRVCHHFDIRLERACLEHRLSAADWKKAVRRDMKSVLAAGKLFSFS